MPYGETGRNRDVKRVFSATLRYLDAVVGTVDHILPHALDLIAEHYGIPCPRPWQKILQHDAPLDLFKGADLVSLPVKHIDSLHGRPAVFPLHAVLSPQGGLVYLRRRRCGRDTAKHYLLNKKGITCAEDSPYIIEAAHIVKHHHKRQFDTRAILTGGITMQVPYSFLFHITN